MAYSFLTDTFDEVKTQAERVYANSPKQLSVYMKELRRWKYMASQDIASEYFAWGANKTIAGSTERPTFAMLRTEIMTVTDEGRARELAMEMNPDIVTFLDGVKLLEDQLAQASLDENKTPGWWKSAGGSIENQEEKRRIHEWYFGGLDALAQKAVSASEETQASIAWMLERIFTPLITNVEFEDEQVFFPPIEPPVPSRDYIGQTNQAPSVSEFIEGSR